MITDRILGEAMKFLSDHHGWVRLIARPIANMPILSQFLKVVPRAYLGATAFEIHDVDIKNGRIKFGEVDEIIFSSKFIELFHKVFAERMGSVEKVHRALYDIAHAGCYWEVDEALKHGRWAPGFLTERLGKPGVIEAIRNDSDFALFVTETFKMVGRLIINEGGWGVTDEIDLVSSPMRITYKNSNEARWNSPAQEPVCYHSVGGIAGYLSRLLGEELHAKEVQCAAMGAPMCVFEIER